jgi:SAM-dependent methyltransferase
MAYDAYTQRHDLYGQASAGLVAAARVCPGETVLDLACGTGVTTAAVLERLGGCGRVVAVDRSPEMLAVARRRVNEPRVDWRCAPAEMLGALDLGRVDVVVCGMAIWQLAAGPTLSGVRELLADGGRFAFSDGMWHFDGPPCTAAQQAREWRTRIRAAGYTLTRVVHQECRVEVGALVDWLQLSLVPPESAESLMAKALSSTDVRLCTIHVVCRPDSAASPQSADHR